MKGHFKGDVGEWLCFRLAVRFENCVVHISLQGLSHPGYRPPSGGGEGPRGRGRRRFCFRLFCHDPKKMADARWGRMGSMQLKAFCNPTRCNYMRSAFTKPAKRLRNPLLCWPKT